MPEMGNAPFEVIKEGAEEVIRINANNWQYTPSIEDNEMVMANAIDRLAEQTHISRVIFNQRKNFSYSYDQTQMLVEIANVYNHFVKQKKVLSLVSLGKYNVSERYAGIQNVVFNLLRMDPIGAYVELIRLLREERIKLDKENVKELVVERQSYINLLVYMAKILENTKLISFVKNELDGYQLGDRSLYRNLFRATILPDFMYTRLMANHPLDGEELSAYQVGNSEVVVYKIPGEIKSLYHVTPPEFKLSDEKYELLTLARNVLAEHKPREQEFLEPEKMRRTFLNIGKDLIQELAESKGTELDYKEIQELAEILVRYTVGFGLIEILLQDEKIQDIVINGPIGDNPIFIVHQEFEECVTNITPGREDADSWASKFRLLSGRPLDEANPVLDTDLSIPGARARVAVMTEPLSPNGLAFALRRHRDEPWTLPLFIDNKMINPLGAGLMSFFTDNARTLLISGTRSSGKTAFMGSLLLEIMKKYRIISVEDVLELPIEYMRKIGYNVQQMKIRAALMKGGTELAADEGIRTSLRLGDSALIVGEIRSMEALALWEAMRVGALANVVAGTIHGADPYGVYDRVVNDLKVPKTSFKATDIIVVANPVKSADGLKKMKRITQITEVRKHWEDDPLREKGFVDLMRYNPKTDTLEATEDLINGDSEVIKAVAGNIKDFVGNWDAVWENIQLRANIKETLVEYAKKTGLRELMEGKFVVLSNDMFHQIMSDVREEVGLDNKRVFFEWEEWLKKEVKKRRIT